MTLSVATGTLLTTTNAAGNTITVSGLGFQPKLVLFSWSGKNASLGTAGGHAKFGTGYMISATDRGGVATQSQNSSANANADSSLYTDACIKTLATSGSVEGALDFDSFTSDGFTLIIDDAFTISYYVNYLAIGGDDLTNVDSTPVTAPTLTAPSFRASTTSAGMLTNSSATVTKPTGTADDDIVVVRLYIESDTAVTAPSRWTLESIEKVTATNADYRVYTYWKRASSEGSSWSWSWSGSIRHEWHCLAISGATTIGNPFNVVGCGTRNDFTNDLFPTATAAVTSGTSLLLWSGVHGRSSGGVDNNGAHATPTGYTERTDDSGHLSTATATQASPGTATVAQAGGFAFAAGSNAPATTWLGAIMADGAQDITTFLFQPDAVLLFGGPTAAANSVSVNSAWSLGVAAGVSPGQIFNYVTAGASKNGEGTMITGRYSRAGDCLALHDGQTLTARASVAEWLSNGFRLNWAVAASSNWRALCLKGPRLYAGHTYTRTHTNNFSEARLPFQPSGLLLASHGASQSSAGTLSTSDVRSVGFGTSATARTVAAALDRHNTASSVTILGQLDTAAYLKIQDNSTPTVDGQLDVVSLDSSGMTLVMDDADPASCFVWYLAFGNAADLSLDAYSLRKAITIDHTNVDADLTDFPLLVQFTDDADIGAVIDSGGLNIRFTASDGTTLLPYERQSFDNTGSTATGLFWVKVPTVAGASNTTIYIHYKGGTGVDGSDRRSVWDESFCAVWHLEQDPNGDVQFAIQDSTVNENMGTPAGTMTSGDLVAGQIGNALDFDGTNDLIVVPNSDSLRRPVLGITVEAVPYIASTGNTGNIVTKVTGTHYYALLTASANQSFDFSVNTSSNATIQKPGGGGGLDPYEDRYNHVVGTYDGAELRVYGNGAQIGTSLTHLGNLVPNTDDLGIAARASATAFVNTKIDEIRISSVVRSAAWIKFTSSNIFEADHEISFGSEEGGGFTATAALTIGAVTATGSGTFDPGTKTAAAAVSAAPLTAAGSATHTAPVYTGAAAVSSGPVTVAVSGTFAVGTWTATAAVSLAAVTASGSATFSPGTKTASASVTVGAITASGIATHTTPVYTGAAAITVAATTASASATHTPPTYTGTSALNVAAVTASGTATHATPVYTGASAVTVAAVTASGTATHTPPTYTATATVSTAATTAQGTAIFASAVYSGNAAVTVAALTASGSATHTPPTYTATAAVNVAAVTVSGTAAVTNPTYTSSAAVNVAATTAGGSATSADPFYTAAAAVSVTAVTANGTATSADPVYTGTGTVVVAAPTASGTASHVPPTYTAAAAATLAAVTASGTATSSNDRLATAAVAVGALTASGTATHVTPTYTGAAAVLIAAITTSGEASTTVPPATNFDVHFTTEVTFAVELATVETWAVDMVTVTNLTPGW